MRRTNRLRLLFSHAWQPALDMVMAALVLGALLLYRLGSLTQGFSAGELATRYDSSSLTRIADNPFFLPYKLLQLLLLQMHHGSPLAMRSVSAKSAAERALSMA